MDYKLKNHQKNELVKLLGNKNTIVYDDFYSAIESEMSESLLPEQGRRTIPAIEIADQLECISNTCMKLQKQLNTLDEHNISRLDTLLGISIAELQAQAKDKQQVIRYSPISIKYLVNLMQHFPLTIAEDFREHYSPSFMSKSLVFFEEIWDEYIAEEIICSNDGKYIAYITIILEEESYEKVRKRVSRSKWYSEFKNRMDS